MDEKDFALRITQLRLSKGVSAREMSLSMGQNPGYINGIESGKALPSISGFFYICDYLNITPMEFFDVSVKNPTKSKELLDATKNLSNEQLEHLIAIAKGLK
ncbi:MAG: helix-turn-helix transcriptional regulator [Ruminococcaceae bacterium]|nr:helix-turn-helix transcriptional regulator [Oscillospiraceae bacterium]